MSTVAPLELLVIVTNASGEAIFFLSCIEGVVGRVIDGEMFSTEIVYLLPYRITIELKI